MAQSIVDPAGNRIDYSYDTNNFPTAVVESLVNGTTTQQNELQLSYSGSLLSSITEKTKSFNNITDPAGSGTAFTTSEETDYTYYSASDDTHGNIGELETATTRDAAGNTLDFQYYRYYTGETGGASGALKYVVGLQSYARLGAALPSGTTPLTASDSDLTPYADTFYAYDSQGRITTRVLQGEGCSACAGGLGSFTFSYSTSSNALGYNSWAKKTVETLPDGTVQTYYYNGYNEQMLEVISDPATGATTSSFTAYDSQGRAVMSANAAAINLPSSLSTLEAYSDLLNSVSGNYQYLNDSAGEITWTTYSDTTTASTATAGNVASYVQSTSISNGETGTKILQESEDYIAINSSGNIVYELGDDTVYANTDGTGARTTSYAYTTFGGTTTIQSMTVTLPTISSGQNGPGTADTITSVFDNAGRLVWSKDADGFISYTAYDPSKGAVTKHIDDVNTADSSDFAGLPSGWSTPTAGGLKLITSYQIDPLGRTTEMTDPNGNVTYTVYDDALHEVRVYPGFNSSTGTTTGPIEIAREYLPAASSGGFYYTETLTSSATPHLTGGVPDGTETIDSSNIQSLSRDFTNSAGQVLWSDRYANLTGVTFSDGVSADGSGNPIDIGTSGTNFYRTINAFDHDGRPNKTVTPTGTIYRTEYDGLGRVISKWVGTDDTPSSGYWSTTNLTGTNMVKVEDDTYDADSNLTSQTFHVDSSSSDDRTTVYSYDWRDRLVATKQGALASASSETDDVHRPITFTIYDNLDEPIEVDQYDGDGITISGSGGTPTAPSSFLLRAKTSNSYDDQGRVYKTQMYSVDQGETGGTAGTVGSSLNTNTFYDHRGNVAAVYAPGGQVTKYAYDGAGRVVKQSVTDGGAPAPVSMNWSNATNLANDVVYSQTLYTYDNNGNVILTTDKQRFDNDSLSGYWRSRRPHQRMECPRLLRRGLLRCSKSPHR